MEDETMNQKLFSKDFTLVVIGQIISLFGNAAIRFALPLYLLNLTGSSALYGTVTACEFIPAVLLSPVGGIVSDSGSHLDILYTDERGESRPFADSHIDAFIRHCRCISTLCAGKYTCIGQSGTSHGGKFHYQYDQFICISDRSCAWRDFIQCIRVEAATLVMYGMLFDVSSYGDIYSHTI